MGRTLRIAILIFYRRQRYAGFCCAYTASYSSVGFNGYPPVRQCII
jgi:hypothetical protein